MSRNLKIILSLSALGMLFYFPFIGQLHLFDWDEINFAESAREMIETGDFLTVRIFYEPFWEKPPLFIWMQVLSMKLFGMNEFAARFPNALAGVITIIYLFLTGKKLLDEKFGIIWAVAYSISLLPFFYFKSGIIDPWFNLFIFIGIMHYVTANRSAANKTVLLNSVISAFFIGLATLTKGPAAVLIFGLVAFVLLITDRFKLRITIKSIVAFFVVFVLIGGLWFIIQISIGNWQTVVDFIVYQAELFNTEVAGPGGFPMYHFVILFFGVFPVSVFAIYSHKRKTGFSTDFEYYRKSMLILLWVVLILFSIVETKIVHYSSMCYFPITFLASYSIYSLLNQENKIIPRWLAICQIITAVIIGIVLISISILGKFPQVILSRITISDLTTLGILNAKSNWTGWESLLGLALIVGTVLSVIYLRKGKLLSGFYFQVVTSAVVIFLVIVIYTPRIEMHSQNANIEFYKSLQGKDVYVNSAFKSYATFFYTKIKPWDDNHPFMKAWKKDIIEQKKNVSKSSYLTVWLGKGEIDKDAYLVVRAKDKEKILNQYPEFRLIDEKNGYVFLFRPATKNDL